MRDGGTGNKPFEGLEEFLRKNRIELKEGPLDTAPDFDDAMKGVRRIAGEAVRVARKAPKRPVPATGGDAAELERALDEEQVINVVNLPEYMEGFVEDINPVVLDKLRDGLFSVERALDLHGYGLVDAEKAFGIFLREAIRDGLRCVQVIHGRGLKSRGEPVLKAGLRSWLMRAINRKWVVAFANAPMPEGGTGATSILLKGKPLKRRIRVIG